MLTLYKNHELLESDYRSIDVVSQSLLRQYALSPTPLHFWLQSHADMKITPAMELGSLLHSRVELRESFFKNHTVLPKGMRKGTKAYKVFEETNKNKTLVK